MRYIVVCWLLMFVSMSVARDPHHVAWQHWLYLANIGWLIVNVLAVMVHTMWRTMTEE